jgi:hypothetical protein
MIELIGYLVFPVFGYAASAGWIGRLPVLQGISVALLVPLLWWGRLVVDHCQINQSGCLSRMWLTLVLSSLIVSMILGSGMALALRKHLVPKILVYLILGMLIAAWCALVHWLRYFAWL